MSFPYTTITKQSPNCPAGANYHECDCKLTSWSPPGPFQGIRTTVVALPKPHYTVLDSNAYKDMDMNIFQFDGVSLSEWFMSDTALMSAMPELPTYWYESWATGPPGIKVSVSALTATSTSTVQGSGHYSSHSAQPANSVTNSVPAPASKASAGSETSSAS